MKLSYYTSTIINLQLTDFYNAGLTRTEINRTIEDMISPVSEWNYKFSTTLSGNPIVYTNDPEDIELCVWAIERELRELINEKKVQP